MPVTAALDVYTIQWIKDVETLNAIAGKSCRLSVG
jgi:hypothetical protein